MQLWRNLALLLVLCGLAGCANLETNAYRVIGATAVTVDGTMNGWGDYVRAGKATAADELKVKGAYQSYQQTMRAVNLAVTAYRAGGDKATLEAALTSLDQNKNKLVDIVQHIFHPGMP